MDAPKQIKGIPSSPGLVAQPCYSAWLQNAGVGENVTFTISGAGPAASGLRLRPPSRSPGSPRLSPRGWSC